MRVELTQVNLNPKNLQKFVEEVAGPEQEEAQGLRVLGGQLVVSSYVAWRVSNLNTSPSRFSPVSGTLIKLEGNTPR